MEIMSQNIETSGSGAALNDTPIPITNVASFKSLSIQIYGTFVGTVVFEGSNNNSNWTSIGLVSVAGGALITSITASAILFGQISTKYFRARVSTYTSGTINALAIFSTHPVSIDDKVTTLSTLSTLTTLTGGGIAHDAADSGNPIKIGGKARNADPAAVANNDRADLYVDLLGKQVMVPLAPRQLIVTGYVTISSTTETTVLAAGGSNNFVDLMSLIITNTSASDTRIDFRDATSGTIRFSVMSKAGLTIVIPLSDLPYPQSAANNTWSAQLASAVTDVRIAGIGAKRAG